MWDHQPWLWIREIYWYLWVSHDRNYLEVKTIKVKSFQWALCKNFYIHRQINWLVGITMLEEVQGQWNLFKKSSYNFLATLSCCIKITRRVVVVIRGNTFSCLFLVDVIKGLFRQTTNVQLSCFEVVWALQVSICGILSEQP